MENIENIDMQKFNRNWVFFTIIITVIIILSIWGYFSQKNQNLIFENRINKELLIPYSKLISEQNYKVAYQNFTSTNYKKKYSLAKFLEVQDSNYARYGKVKSFKLVSGVFIKELNSEKQNIFKFTVLYEALNTKKNIILEIIIEDDKIKLNNSYDSFLTISNITPAIY